MTDHVGNFTFVCIEYIGRGTKKKKNNLTGSAWFTPTGKGKGKGKRRLAEPSPGGRQRGEQPWIRIKGEN